jgi:nicotinate-nucleotide adenylyltransferase
VLLMPANSSPHKRNEQYPGPRERMHMCELAVAGQEGLQACAIELDREAPSYTVETLERLHEAHPDAGFTFIAGADTARTLPWREPAPSSRSLRWEWPSVRASAARTSPAPLRRY